MLTKKGVFGIVHGTRQPPSRDRSENRRAVRRRRLLRQYRRRARGEGVDPALRRRWRQPDHLRVAACAIATALAFHPDTGDLYTVVQERDGLGDNLLPDYMTRVQQGAFLRLALFLHRPASAAGLRAVAARQGEGRGYARRAVPAHSSAMDILFYTGSQFPAEYQRRRLRRAQRIVEPLRADRLQGRARAVQGRQAARLLPELRHRLLGLRAAPRRSLGPAGRARRRQGRRAADRRRHRRHDLAHRLHRSKAGRQRGAAADHRRRS